MILFTLNYHHLRLNRLTCWLIVHVLVDVESDLELCQLHNLAQVKRHEELILEVFCRLNVDSSGN